MLVSIGVGFCCVVDGYISFCWVVSVRWVWFFSCISGGRIRRIGFISIEEFSIIDFSGVF